MFSITFIVALPEELRWRSYGLWVDIGQFYYSL